MQEKSSTRLAFTTSESMRHASTPSRWNVSRISSDRQIYAVRHRVASQEVKEKQCVYIYTGRTKVLYADEEKDSKRQGNIARVRRRIRPIYASDSRA